MGCTYFGRRKIFSIEEKITRDNVWDVVKSALAIHSVNRHDITYLYDYYKGDQPALYREKAIRPDINNKIVVNRAAEIVAFKTGYLLGEPIQYVRRDGNRTQSDDVRRLNDFMISESKETKDICLANWMYIAGTGYRMVMAKENEPADKLESPFEFWTIDPRECFVGYSREVGNKPVFACIQSTPVDTVNKDNEYTVYTTDRVFKISNGDVISDTPNNWGFIPIIEYPENDSRLGAFEIVLPILDGISEVLSSSVDDIQQTVQALLVLVGVDIEQKDADGNTVSTIESIRQNGGISIPEGCDAKYLSLQLNQGQTQTVLNNLEQEWLEICGMPNRNGGGSTSDTGSAVYLRDGFTDAETRAMNTQRMWVQTEMQFLKDVLAIMNKVDSMDITAYELTPHFNRQNGVNLQSKTQSYCELLASGYISPLWALKISQLAFDTESCYEDGMKWHEEQEQKQVEELKQAMESSNQGDNHSNSSPESKPPAKVKSNEQKS